MSSPSFPTPDGELLSASQIETWRLCPRKWAWGKIDRIEGVPNIAAEKGSIIHEVLEAWLRDGKTVDPDATVTLSNGTTFQPGRIAAAGLKYLPVPKSCGTERRIFVKTPVAKYQGYIDYDVLALEIPIIGDHKSTGDFKWAKTPDDLKTDVAASIYAGAIMSETGKDEVELHWVYYRTKGKAISKRVSLVILRAEVEKNFEEIDKTALEILEARKTVKTALDLPPNPSACDAFGGCPFRENCNLTTLERMKGLMAQESLADRMKARAAGNAGTNGAAAPGNNPAAAAGTINSPEGTQPATEVAAATPAATTAPATAAKKTRGKGKTTASAQKTTPAATPAPTQTTAAASEQAQAPLTGGFTLFIDCQPIKGLVCIPARMAMELAHGDVRQQQKVADYRLVDFGKGAGCLAVALNQRLTDSPLIGVGVFVDTRTPEGRDTVNIFEQHATAVVRSVA